MANGVASISQYTAVGTNAPTYEGRGNLATLGFLVGIRISPTSARFGDRAIPEYLISMNLCWIGFAGFLAISICRADNTVSSLDPEISVMSPDRQFTVRQREDMKVEVLDNKSAGNIPAGPFFVYYPDTKLLWTLDSKMIIAIGHVSDGTTASIIDLSSNGWHSFDPIIPFESAIRIFGEILRAKVGWDSVKFTYKIKRLYDRPIISSNPTLSGNLDAKVYKYFVYSFVIKHGSMAKFDEKWRAIDRETYETLKPVN